MSLGVRTVDGRDFTMEEERIESVAGASVIPFGDYSSCTSLKPSVWK
jgi:hypothetical protein